MEQLNYGKHLTNAKAQCIGIEFGCAKKVARNTIFLRKCLHFPVAAKIIIAHTPAHTVGIKSQDHRIYTRAALIVNCQQQSQLHSRAGQIPHNQVNKSEEFPTSTPKFWPNTTELRFPQHIAMGHRVDRPSKRYFNCAHQTLDMVIRAEPMIGIQSKELGRNPWPNHPCFNGSAKSFTNFHHHHYYRHCSVYSVHCLAKKLNYKLHSKLQARYKWLLC